MDFQETFHWILDDAASKVFTWNEEATRQDIAFIQSLGLKCDCVGWCRLDLNGPRTEEILTAVEAYCKTRNRKVRGYYTRTYTAQDCQWFELVPTAFRENTVANRQTIPCENGETDYLPILRAYREASAGIKGMHRTYVPARFRNACLCLGVPENHFCWLRDVGKYAGEQYFALYPSQWVAHIGASWVPAISYSGQSVLNVWKYQEEDAPIAAAVGGWLPRVASLCYNLRVDLQDCYLAEDMPSDGLAIACCHTGQEAYFSRNTILLHRSMAEKLLEARVLLPQALRPAFVTPSLPAGYLLLDARPPRRPEAAFLGQNLREYEAFRQDPKPVRKIKEAEALTQLRRGKRERKEDFQKPLPKKQAEALEITEYAPLIPYYRISNGGYLSDEYTLLPYPQAVQENREFQGALQKEELLETPPEGIVIAKCADGDTVLLCMDGSVIRFSHEEPVVLASWDSAAQFVYEALTETE